MHIAGVPAGSLGPSLTWGQVWEGKESACLPALQELPVLSSGAALLGSCRSGPSWRQPCPCNTQNVPGSDQRMGGMAGGLSPLQSSGTSPRHKDSSVGWEDSRGLVLWVANWANRGARDSLIYPASGSKARARP